MAIKIDGELNPNRILHGLVHRMISSESTTETEIATALWVAGLALETAGQRITDLTIIANGCDHHRSYRGENRATRSSCEACEAIREARLRLAKPTNTTGEWARGTIFEYAAPQTAEIGVTSMEEEEENG